MNDGRESSADRLLALIGEHQATIREALDEEQHALLLARLGALSEVAPDDVMAIGRALQGVKLALLPLPLDHPVRAALESLRFVAVPPGPSTVAGAQALLALLSTPSPSPGPEAAPSLEQLLLARALSAEEAWARCGGAAPPPELIRLSDPQGGVHYPEFQFAAGSGTPYEVVLEVNRLLLADIDPRGAAAWWLSSNIWLDGTPVSLLGRLPDQQLVGAATALVEGD
ncbi:hypothetical protein [Nonomuraea sp. NPDC049625]|uniref:hypothetical protein n=1 Tax=Nonomuraea sp. NPDC049625 TaxID=3155775 RepID=UPI00341A1FDB